MKIILNNKEIDVPQVSTLASFLETSGKHNGRVLLNGNMINASDYNSLLLKDNDRIVVIPILYGG